MSYLITIDGGTTNTRAFLWKNNEVIASASREVGARNTAVSSSEVSLKNAVKACINEILKTASVTCDELDGIVASGMLTSNVGLIEIPHLPA